MGYGLLEYGIWTLRWNLLVDKKEQTRMVKEACGDSDDDSLQPWLTEKHLRTNRTNGTVEP